MARFFNLLLFKRNSYVLLSLFFGCFLLTQIITGDTLLLAMGWHSHKSRWRNQSGSVKSYWFLYFGTKRLFTRSCKKITARLLVPLAVFSRRVLLIFKPRKEHFFAEGCFTVSICHLLDICNRLARHFSLGMQANFSKQIFKIFALAAVHTDAFWTAPLSPKMVASKLVFSKVSVFAVQVRCRSLQFSRSFLFYASSLQRVQHFRLL